MDKSRLENKINTMLKTIYFYSFELKKKNQGGGGVVLRESKKKNISLLNNRKFSDPFTDTFLIVKAQKK